MKKLLAMLLAAAMVVGLTACGGGNTPTAAPTTSAPTTAAPTTVAPTTVAPTTVAPAPAETTTVAPAPAETTTQAPETTTAAPETTTAAPEPVVPEIPEEIENPEFLVKELASKEYGKDYTSLYEKYGKDTSIADVIEDPETGFAYIQLEDGSLHQLGLDFLTMAMVYNIDPEGSDYATQEEVYAAWWRLYITRWNYLLPEVPLYSNEYYNFFNAQITGVEEHPINPYWDPASALVDWGSEKADKDIILGKSTELSGQFRYPTFGKTSPGASDSDVGDLVNGLETVSTTKDGGYVWNDTVVKAHEEVINDDGSKTFTITIHDDLKFSDGSPVTSKDYLAFTLALASPVGTQASGKNMTLNTTVGGPDFVKYTGPDSKEGTKELAGLRMIDEYTFSVTIPSDYIPYFYDITYAGFSASYTDMWLGGATIQDDGNGVYLSDDFYEMDGDTYTHAEQIKFACQDTTAENWKKWPFSGQYMVDSFDTTDSSAVLVLNPEYKGNYEGTKPTIEKITYRRVVSATQLEQFKAGEIDVLAEVTGGAATDEAVEYANANPDKVSFTHYSRAGYGKLGFRNDYGPVQFHEVRQAIAYCMDRAKFAKDFTGGYGGVVDGPYYTGSWMYGEAVNQGMMLDSYPTSSDSAIEVLEENGWVYDKDGNDYTEGVRYKKIPGALATENDINYKSMDGAYTTTKVGDDYYMPLAINWFGTSENEFTDLLQTGFRENANVAAAGMVVYNQLGDFGPMLDELYQQAVYGFYAGTPMYCAFNFATGYTSAAYDYSWNMTIDPSMYDDYSSYYIKDWADVLILE